jgi:hypothetical protein
LRRPRVTIPEGGIGRRRRRRVFWRTRVRPVWRGRRWQVIGGLAVGVFVLGCIGYRSESDEWDVVAYQALQLFGLESEQVQDPNAALTIARVLAPLVAAAAAVQAIASIFREQAQLLGLRFFTRDLRVIVGLGSVGFRLATAMHESGAKVVAVERDPSNASIAGCRERGIPVVKGDATDVSILRRTRLGRARDVFITCGDDGVNLDVARAATRTPTQRRPLRVHVHLRDLALWRPLQAQILSAPDPPLRLEFFNVLEAGARVLLEQHPGISDGISEAPRRPHVLFVGLDEVGEFAVLQLAGRWRNLSTGPDEALRISVVGPAADAQVLQLLECYPELEDICELSSESIAVSAARFQRGEMDCLRVAGAPVTAVYVCLARETDGLTAALALRGLPALSQVPLVVALQDEETGIAGLIDAGSGRLGDVAEFGVLSRALVADVALGTNEVLARLRHDEYMRGERSRGATVMTNPSMVPWEDLPESLRDSNRAFADGIGRKLTEYGCALVPAPLSRADGADPVFAPGEVEELAREEHDRWMNDLRMLGWSATRGPKDPAHKLHPLLVDWEDLSEVDRERDRESIRALPSMLARAGFAVHRGPRPAP